MSTNLSSLLNAEISHLGSDDAFLRDRLTMLLIATE